ncbi:MAG TPA: UDP-N-acetylglucosamine pyrophosphorylase, partial [Candidatus Aminicenantes bacterium]|nr:UDP-N-acetylglucosamine pyrophosphorylase [Candidatus Aminicenantes bacterium]
PRGVMLKSPPIFLGGQGGLVGPARIGFGTVIAAGTVWRGDCPEGGALLSAANHDRSRAFTPGVYGDIRRRVLNNLHYVGNLLALRQWYLHVRRPFFRGEAMGAALFDGAIRVLEAALAERLSRFEALAGKMERSVRHLTSQPGATLPAHVIGPQRALAEGWPRLKAFLTAGGEETVATEQREAFVRRLDPGSGSSGYIAAVQGLDAASAATGTAWLQRIVDTIVDGSLEILPGCR